MMSMTVGQLIKALKKYPTRSKVAFAAFDLGIGEMDGLVNNVIELGDEEDELGNAPYRDHGPIPVIRG